MFHCELRALTDRGEPVYFQASDVPVCIDSEHFILANREDFPLLRTETLCRAMKSEPLAEGDLISIAGREYLVTYYKGFSFKAEDGTFLTSDLVKSYTVLQRGVGEISKLQFKYRDTVFQLQSIVGCVDGEAVLTVCKEPVDPSELQVSAGFTSSRRKLFYGDKLSDGELVMWCGRPCVWRDGHYVEVPTGRIIGEGICVGSD